MSIKSLFSRTWPVIVFGAALALAAFVRFWAAPISNGPDVNQFWAFAEVFHFYGIDFYRYADAKLIIFPTKGWIFVYPPVWLLVLGFVLLFVPSSNATVNMVDTGWRIAMKSPVILADLGVGILLFWAVPGPGWRKLLFASLWLFHPTAWYESAVFGQFDSIAAGLLLFSVIMLIRGNDMLAFFLAGLAIMTKQHTFLSVAMMIIISARYLTKRRLLIDCVIVTGVIILLSLPFLVTGNLYSYGRSILFPGSAPDYQDPLCFAFSGIGSFLTYLHNILGWDTAVLLPDTIPVLLISLIIIAVLSYKKRITPLQGALVGFLAFIALHYRINYQYLVVYIPLALLQAARTPYRSEKAVVLAVALLPAVWIWLTNIPFWFDNNPSVNNLLARIGLPERYLPDYAYVAFAMALMFLSLAYIVLVFWRWGPKHNGKSNSLNNRENDNIVETTLAD
jgi:hypothetical protein